MACIRCRRTFSSSTLAFRASSAISAFFSFLFGYPGARPLTFEEHSLDLEGSQRGQRLSGFLLFFSRFFCDSNARST